MPRGGMPWGRTFKGDLARIHVTFGENRPKLRTASSTSECRLELMFDHTHTSPSIQRVQNTIANYKLKIAHLLTSGLDPLNTGRRVGYHRTWVGCILMSSEYESDSVNEFSPSHIALDRFYFNTKYPNRLLTRSYQNDGIKKTAT